MKSTQKIKQICIHCLIVYVLKLRKNWTDSQKNSRTKHLFSVKRGKFYLQKNQSSKVLIILPKNNQTLCIDSDNIKSIIFI